MKNKVLLVYPGDIHSITKRMPLSILYLAEALINKGFEPVILDMQVSIFKPEMLKDCICAGISALTGKQISYAIKIAKEIRKYNSSLPLVWGGIHPSTMPEQTISHPLVDIIVYGEGEETFPELVQLLQTGQDYRGLLGIVHKTEGQVTINPRRPFIQFNKPNVLPYDLLDLKKYQTSVRFEYQSSRGCPHGCNFCYNKKFNYFKWRAKDASIVLDELEAIKKRFNPQFIHFVDDEFFIDKKRSLDVIKGMIERKFNFNWKPAIRIDAVNRFDDEMFRSLRESGCYEFCMGAESGSNKILKLINKNITDDDIIRSAEHTKNKGVNPQYSFMSGFPGETIEDLHLTVNCIDKLWKTNENIIINGLFQATPFPGTDFYDLIKQQGNYPLPANLEEWASTNVFIARIKKIPYLSLRFLRELRLYSAMVYFIFVWMYSQNYVKGLKERKESKTSKYYKFKIFHFLFKPFYHLIRYRFSKRNTMFPIDVFFVRSFLLVFSQ